MKRSSDRRVTNIKENKTVTNSGAAVAAQRSGAERFLLGFDGLTDGELTRWLVQRLSDGVDDGLNGGPVVLNCHAVVPGWSLSVPGLSLSVPRRSPSVSN